MRSDATFAYQEQERDSALLARHLKGQADLASPAARHHLSGGFNRRLLMLATGRRAIEAITHSPRDAPIGAHRAMELGIQLNAYYLNLCGALDNLAWAMQYEWDVLPGVKETGPGRQKCGLFTPAFTRALTIARPQLASALESHRDWYDDLRDLRDPAAHRVPLYAIPGYMTEADAVECRQLQATAVAKGHAGDHHGMMQLMHRSTMLGGYAPYMAIWTPEGEQLVDAWQSVVRDHHQFQIVAQLVSGTLISAPAG
jgi:hypothetical protein